LLRLEERGRGGGLVRERGRGIDEDWGGRKKGSKRRRKRKPFFFSVLDLAPPNS
jgi:hypothetical protein